MNLYYIEIKDGAELVSKLLIVAEDENEAKWVERVCLGHVTNEDWERYTHIVRKQDFIYNGDEKKSFVYLQWTR